ncbi:DNA adenine methylase [Mucilaginibacter sp. SG538B]|uniref:DNA adenine methylase n=1 Tax=Mucilaginibacter sp. SG538B TaxID=2587021 RepID=UPI00159DB4FE|nr:Dam family site-specific DNA-(adenine-N6)-methyltransferase [Mucilaginibacter sp. SG538B]NVM63218.1 DNA adenine methylase [Mucilaginibacter sp. SG538B]
MIEKKVLPFLKWAGGKRWLTNNLLQYLPNTYNRYFEPFLGSGAVFFSLQPKQAVLSDVNHPLIKTYNAIKEDYKMVNNLLIQHSERHSNEYYYEIRDTDYSDQFQQAARFIYLNRTCFNAIYRVNKNGKFNVPRGSKNNVILDSDDFESVSRCLKSADIKHSDFECIIGQAMAGDLIYVDPPYTVKHNNNGFVKYNEKMFTWQDQERLSVSLFEAQKRGAHIVMSNADHASIRELYSNNSKITALQRSSVIASDPINRGQYSELIISI